MYELLGQIYKEIFDMFDTDVFHMGGDEVQRTLVLNLIHLSVHKTGKLLINICCVSIII